MLERKNRPGGLSGVSEAVSSSEASDPVTTLIGDSSSRSTRSLGLQLVVLEATGLSIYPLPDSGSISIGRADDCHARLTDALASRRHAVLHLGPLAIEDNDSANGTRLGMRRLEAGAAVEIQPGQTISIGSSLLIVRSMELSRSCAVAPERSTTPNPFALGRTIIVRDPAMQRLFALVDRLAQGLINVLILGETGVGKEVVAEAIHRASPRSEAPFIRINCAALSETLLESDLFGHERGAFTGAVTAKPGLLELANGGNVFLDEVGELSPSLQAKLLRVIETHEAMRVGGLRARPIDVRFLFATNRDLELEVARGAFRADLFFRLKGAALEVPPLRERSQEIIPLAEAFLSSAAARMNLSNPPILTHEARASLLAYAWPGNVRELRNVVERAVLLCTDESILAVDLALEVAATGPVQAASAADARRSTQPAGLGQDERERIAQALLDCGGNQSRAAESLKIPRRTLVRKIAQLGLPRPRGQG
jgi:two-component system, NtrC family, response regulator AtoC